MKKNLNDCALYYTTIDGSKAPFSNDMFDAHIVEHSYENGQGILFFDQPITELGLYQNTWVHWNNKLKSMIIPNSVITLRDKALSRLKHIETIVLSDNISTIPNNAFKGCSSLMSITIPNSITHIGSYAFEGCRSLTKIIIPNSVSSIGVSAFEDCCSIASITIGSNVTSIGDAAFRGCTSLTTITIPDSVVEIGNAVFYGCTTMENFYGKFASKDNNSLIVNGKLLSCANVCHGTYTIPYSVIAIGDNAFKGCSLITNIIIPDSVTTIGNKAFCECTSLKSIAIPDSVVSIGNDAFCNCSNLVSITIPNSVTSIGRNAFHGCKSLPIIDSAQYADTYLAKYLDTTAPLVNIKDGVRWIGDYAFSNCWLNRVVIPDSVISIGDNAFECCTNLENIDIGNGVKEIGSNVFNCCDKLKSIYIPDSVIKVGSCTLRYIDLAIMSGNIHNISEAFMKSNGNLTIIFTSFNIKNLYNFYGGAFRNARIYIPSNSIIFLREYEHYLVQMLNECQMVYKYESSELSVLIDIELKRQKGTSSYM